MAQNSSKGMDSGFIELAQEQLDAVNGRLAQIDGEIAGLQGERAMLLGQRANLHGLVNPSAKTNGARGGKADVQSTRDAVVDLIRESGAAMHYRDDIYPRLVQAGHEIGGKDPANTVLSRIFNDERLRRTGPGMYGLAEWRGGRIPRTLKPAKPASRQLAVLEAVEEVLREAGSPLHYNEIAKRMLKARLWTTKGKTPGATVGARIYKNIGDVSGSSKFLKLGGGLIGLRGRDGQAG